MLSAYGDANIRAKVSSDAFVGIEPFAAVPNEIMLFPNYPNPFNPETTFSFNIGSLQQTSLRIYDIQGRLIETINRQNNPAKTGFWIWNVRSDLSPGVYIFQLRTEDSAIAQRAIKM